VELMPSSNRVAIISAVLAAVTSSPLQARPPHRQALADYFGPFLAKKLNDCRTCHLPDPLGQSSGVLVSDKPHNAFGARLKAVKRELRKAGKPITIAARLEAVADEDSDGDGVSNLIELLTGHFPGDPADKPTADEIAGARQKLREFRTWQKEYAWRPFEKVQRPAVPAVKNSAWVRTPIDSFIAAEHERHGLKPRPEASRVILLRRVYLDLIGLPPTPEELHAFLADTDPEAYEKMVDRLLQSPQYGERWGRHWMDIWRYSDWAGWTDGGQIRDSQPHIWRWRDWIVESLNQDKGYDRMIVEMLAGDELAPEDPATLRATGYLARNYKMLSREKWMQDTVNHTAQAFLGVTLGCARCHDHMYDPILQKEYYEVRAIFEPYNVRIDHIQTAPETKEDGLARVYDADPEVPTYLFIRGDDRTPDTARKLPPAVPELFGGSFPSIQPITLPPAAYAPDKQPSAIAHLRKESEAEIGQAKKRFKAVVLPASAVWLPPEHYSLASLAKLPIGVEWQGKIAIADLDLRLAFAKQNALEMVLRVEEVEDAGRKATPEWESAAMMAVTTQRIVRALQAQREAVELLYAPPSKDKAAQALLNERRAAAQQAVERTLADVLAYPDTSYQSRHVASYPRTSTGRRLAFARWIANRENPLTARVAVNHIWLRHFGQAIVPTVFDFGRNGRPPSHPALLDWLAAEFMARNWSMKELHRLIVTSSTYRMASTTDPVNTALDRDNVYLWHMPSRRMEAEVVRDCLFYVAGKLDPARGGPEIDQHQGLVVPRRSLYFRHAAEKQMEFLKIFDGPAVSECYQRKESVMPQQALALVNSELTMKHARLLARELAARVGSDAEAFTTSAFERVLARSPAKAEKAECLAFLIDQVNRYRQRKAAIFSVSDPGVPAADAELRARENLVHVLMNHNDFVTIR
jgi:hypothetical protein